MANEEQRLELAIKARAERAELIGQTTREVQALREQLKLLKAETGSSADSNRRLGETQLALQAATQRQQQALREATGTVSQFQQAQEALRATLERVATNLSGNAGLAASAAASTNGMGLAIGVAAGAAAILAGGIVAASKSIGEFQEKQDVLSNQLDVSQHDLGGLQLATLNVHKSFDEVQPSLFIFTRKLGDAREELKNSSDTAKNTARVFGDLGVSINNSDGSIRPTIQILQDVATKLDSVGDKAQRNRVLVELFGRGGSQVLPILTQNIGELADKAEQLGLTLSESQQKTARDADTAWDRLKASSTGLKNHLLVTFAPLGTAIANALSGAIEGLKSLNSQSENTDMSKAISELDRLHNMALTSTTSMNTLADSFRSVAEAQQALAAGLITGKEFDKIRQRLGLPSPTEREGSPTGSLVTQTVNQTVNRSALSKTAAGVGLQIPAVGNIAAVKQAVDDQTKAEAGLTDEQEQQLRATEKTLAAMKLRLSIGAQTVEEEAKALDSMRSQVLSGKELQEIDQRRKELAGQLPQRLFDFPKPPPGFFEGLTEEQKKQLDTTLKTLDAMKERLSLGAETADQEREILERMEKQVLSEKELEAIRLRLKELGPVFEFPKPPKPGDNQKAADKEKKQREESLANAFGALNTGAQAVLQFAKAVKSSTSDFLQAIGQLIAGMLAAIGQATGNAALGPIGGFIGTVAGIFGLREGGQVLMPAVAMAGGGQLSRPLMLQSGTVLSGNRTKDTEHAFIMNGEAVLSTALTTRLDHYLRDNGGKQSQVPTGDVNSISFGENSVVINVHGSGVSVQDLRQDLVRRFLPELSRQLGLRGV